MRRAQCKYPADFWINHRLGVDLTYKQDRDEIREGIGFLHVAVALRPRSSHPALSSAISTHQCATGSGSQVAR